MKRFYKIDKNEYAEIKLNKKIYNISVIEKTLTNFIDKLYVKIEEKGSYFIIKIKVKKDKEIKEEKEYLERIIGDFYNELLVEDLRYKVSIETKNIRELIVGRALYTTCIENEEDEDDHNEKNEKRKNYEDKEQIKISDLKDENDEDEEKYDIDDIAVNWFEKNKEE